MPAVALMRVFGELMLANVAWLSAVTISMLVAYLLKLIVMEILIYVPGFIGVVVSVGNLIVAQLTHYDRWILSLLPWIVPEAARGPVVWVTSNLAWVLLLWAALMPALSSLLGLLLKTEVFLSSMSMNDDWREHRTVREWSSARPVLTMSFLGALLGGILRALRSYFSS
ncbi:hypothetical protein ACEK07_17525 [Alcanivoracaceae bacterium MT1]